MRIIGLTGGIASGKSTVSKILKEFGACIIDADKLSREIVEPGKPAWQEIRDWLGPDYILPDGNIDRRKIGDYIFNDSEARLKLETITHQRILDAVNSAITEAKNSSYPVAVLDVPLLFESGWASMADETWVAYTDVDSQLDRLMKRDGLSRQQAEARIASQMSLKAKSELADVVIDNSKDINYTRMQIETSWAKVVDKA